MIIIMIYNDNDNMYFYIYSLYSNNDIISSIHFISLLPRQFILQLVGLKRQIRGLYSGAQQKNDFPLQVTHRSIEICIYIYI